MLLELFLEILFTDLTIRKNVQKNMILKISENYKF